MKYVVTVNGERIEVAVDADGARLDASDGPARLAELEGTPVRLITIGDAVHRAVVRRGDTRGRYTLWLDGFRYDVEALDERTHAIRELSSATAGPAGPAPVKAPMPGLVIRVNVAVGDQVAAGQGLVVIEAMKMENELRSVAPGRVRAIHAVLGQAVEKGALLVEIE